MRTTLIRRILDEFAAQDIADLLPPAYSKATIETLLSVSREVRLPLGRFERAWTPAGEVYGPGPVTYLANGSWIMGEVPEE